MPPIKTRTNAASTSAFAKTLTVRVATYLAELIASLLRPVLYHPHMIQFDDDTEPLLTSQLWVRPVYEELLHAASRFNMSPAAEWKRPTSNLVKVSSHPRAKPQVNANMHPLHAPITEGIVAECPVEVGACANYVLVKVKGFVFSETSKPWLEDKNQLNFNLP